jgi:parvulin-like peptidyl-prolyl isomerase
MSATQFLHIASPNGDGNLAIESEPLQLSTSHMTQFLEIGNFQVSAAELVPLLRKYQMLPAFIRELTIDRAISMTECDADEINEAITGYGTRFQITNDEQLEQWLAVNNLTRSDYAEMATREYRLEKFKRETFGKKVESHFLTRKYQLDRAIYSLIRTNDIGIAQEVYFRLCDGEQTFDALAREYSQGAESQTGGLIGPVELSTPHPIIAKLLSSNPPGKICPPIQLEQWFVIVRLEQMFPAQLDDPMRARLTNELFQIWLQKELSN